MIKTVISAVFLFCYVFATTSVFAQSNPQANVDESVLSEYFKDNKIKAVRTSSGLYYVVTKPGSGEHAKAGQTVNMKYLGKFLDGKQFDANMDANYNLTRSVLSFKLGQGRVIRGWDEGVQLLNPGARATFYIPSGLGYGPGNVGPIPPNSILVFDVELVSVN